MSFHLLSKRLVRARNLRVRSLQLLSSSSPFAVRGSLEVHILDQKLLSGDYDLYQVFSGFDGFAGFSSLVSLLFGVSVSFCKSTEATAGFSSSCEALLAAICSRISSRARARFAAIIFCFIHSFSASASFQRIEAFYLRSTFYIFNHVF